MLEALIILGLAGHRLWVLWLTQEIFRPFRERIARIHSKLAYGVNCGVCTSVWIAAVMVFLWWLSGVWFIPVFVLAVSELLAWAESIVRAIGVMGILPTRTDENGNTYHK